MNELDERILKAVMGGVTSDAQLKILKQQLPQTSKFKGEAVVKLNFELSKGADDEAANTAGILSQAVLSRALVKSGIQVENFLRDLKEAAIEAATMGEKLAEVLSDEDKRVSAMMDRVKAEVVAVIPKQKKTGSVRVKAIPEFQSVHIEEVKS